MSQENKESPGLRRSSGREPRVEDPDWVCAYSCNPRPPKVQ